MNPINILTLLAVAVFGLGVGTFTSSRYWANEGCAIMYKVPPVEHEPAWDKHNWQRPALNKEYKAIHI